MIQQFFVYAYLGVLGVLFLAMGIAGVWHAISPDDEGVRVVIWPI